MYNFLAQDIVKYYVIRGHVESLNSVAERIDFLVFTPDSLESMIHVLPNYVVVRGVEIVLSEPDCNRDCKLDNLVHGQIINDEQVTPSDPNAVVIEVDENSSVAVLVIKQRRNSLIASTKHCFIGFRVDNARCLNRRRPGSDSQVWCHHQLSQKVLFDAMRKSENADAPKWW